MRQQIAAAINLVVQVSRLSDGARKVMTISEIVGMEGDIITMQDIFTFERQGIAEDDRVMGRFAATGIRPKFTERLKAYGVDLSALLFLNRDGRTPSRDRW